MGIRLSDEPQILQLQRRRYQATVREAITQEESGGCSREQCQCPKVVISFMASGTVDSQAKQETTFHCCHVVLFVQQLLIFCQTFIAFSFPLELEVDRILQRKIGVQDAFICEEVLNKLLNPYFPI